MNPLRASSLAGLDEEVSLDVPLHLLHGGDEVVVAPVHLVLAPRPRRVRHARTEPLGKLQKNPAESVSHRSSVYDVIQLLTVSRFVDKGKMLLEFGHPMLNYSAQQPSNYQKHFVASASAQRFADDRWTCFVECFGNIQTARQVCRVSVL